MNGFESEYSQISAGCTEQLKDLWASLEFSEYEQEQALIRIRNNAKQVWLAALKNVQNNKQNVTLQIQNLYDNICLLKEQLQGVAMDQDLIHHTNQVLQEVDNQKQYQLRSQLRKLQQYDELWQVQKQILVDEITKIKTEVDRLKHFLGLQDDDDKFDDLTTNLQDMLTGLQRNKQQLQQQKMIREDLLRREVIQLQQVCSRLGENFEVLLKNIHPKLYVFANNKKLFDVGGDQVYIGNMAFLDDQTINAVTQMKESLQQDEVIKEQQVSELQDKMTKLWSQLEISEDDQTRQQFEEFFTSSYRLYGDIIEQYEKEVGRLQNAKISRLRGVLKTKLKNLEQLCQATHLPDLPELQQLKPDELEMDLMEEQVINKLMINVGQFHEQVEQLAAKRAPVLKVIQEVISVTEEVQWLAQYEQDENRFKGRDSNRRLQRALKAGKLKLRLPTLVNKAIAALKEWEANNGEPFHYDNYENYLKDVLSVQAQQMTNRKIRLQNTKSSTLPKFSVSPKKETKASPPISRTVSAPYNKKVYTQRTTQSLAYAYPSSKCDSNEPIVKGMALKDNNQSVVTPDDTTFSGNSFASISTPVHKKDGSVSQDLTEDLPQKNAQPKTHQNSLKSQISSELNGQNNPQISDSQKSGSTNVGNVLQPLLFIDNNIDNNVPENDQK